MVTQSYSGTAFESFLSNIKQECIIFIDEFEKIFTSDKRGDDKQNSLLSIFDGVFESKKLFLLTANDTWGINDAFMNRPGRIRYLKQYSGLSDEVINDVIDDILINKEYKDELINIANIIGTVNMDSLITIIEEMNMYGESAKMAINNLNIKPEDAFFEISWQNYETYNKDGKVVKELIDYKARISGHPLTGELDEFQGYGQRSDDKRVREYVYIDIDNAEVINSKDSIRIKYENIEYTFKRSEKFNFVY